jgi:hypothetical protein
MTPNLQEGSGSLLSRRGAYSEQLLTGLGMTAPPGACAHEGVP